MNTTTTLRGRVSRFMSDRYAYRERPGYFTELFVFGLIVVLATWPMLSLANAMAAMR